MARPYWTGNIQISLVSFGVSLYVATETKSQISFHQISRRTGERIRHQKVLESAAENNEPTTAVEKDEIVKGYEGTARGNTSSSSPPGARESTRALQAHHRGLTVCRPVRFGYRVYREAVLRGLTTTRRRNRSMSFARRWRKRARSPSAKSRSQVAKISL